MRIAFIGCVEFSFVTLNHLLTHLDVEVVGIVTRKESVHNADFCSLENLADRYGIPCFFAQGNNQEDMAVWLVQLEPDIIYCFGWSYLLKDEILKIPRLGVIGYHPAALPKNRGRHPIIWALALGLTETASTFFFMDEGADSGDILNQRGVQINSMDDASTLYKKLNIVAREQITEFTPQLATNCFQRIPQDPSRANYWRKRTKSDGQIDWRMSSKNIHNLVRALTRPYVGAHCICNHEEVKIWRTDLFSPDMDCTNVEPGKVLKIENSDIIIKCGEGALRIIEHGFVNLPREGCYL